jgi:hypothetical protein
MDIKIKKLTVKSTLLKNSKFTLVIEFYITVTYIEAPRLYKSNPHLTIMKRRK